MIREKIAVIGSGISGLSAAFFLSKKFEVHLLEKNNLLGGHTRTVDFSLNDKKFSIDTGFIVFNKKNYPDLTSFFNILNVQIEKSEMSFAFSCKEKDFEYGGSNFNSLFAKRNNIFSLKFIFFIVEILKFYRHSKKIFLKGKINKDITIDEFLNENFYSKQLREYHIYPMISSIWSTNIKDVRKFPLYSFINFFSNHGLFDLKNRPQWQFVKNGSKNYIKELIKKNLFEFKTNFAIKKILRINNKIEIIDQNNKIHKYDKIIIATHADQALKLIDSPTTKELKILSCFNYSANIAYLHYDESFMPKRKKIWSSWNFLQGKNKNNFSLTYWMNKLQKISSEKNFFVTINPDFKPKNVIDEIIFEHPVFTIATREAQVELKKIQGIKNTFFCGSYFGYGFHEDGIQSAANIANLLNVELPWKRDKKFKSRINYD